MRSLQQYILEGGHSIDIAQPIRGDLASKVAIDVIDILHKKFPNIECSPLGSTGKKTKDQSSGDIDIAIEYNWDKMNDIKDYIYQLSNITKGNVNDKLHVFNVGWEYNYDNDEKKIVQVDFMFVDNVEFAKFAYHSPDFTKNESKYKGMYQSALLMAILSCTPIKDKKIEYFDNGDPKVIYKYFLDQSKGLYIKKMSYEGKDDKQLKNAKKINEEFVTSKPKEIINIALGPKGTQEDCNSFESLLSFICSDKYINKDELNNIKDKFMNDWQIKMKTSQDTMNELSELFDKYIKEKI